MYILIIAKIQQSIYLKIDLQIVLSSYASLIDSTVDPVDTPCAKYLPIDEFGPSAHGEFSYPSVFGQLNYL